MPTTTGIATEFIQFSRTTNATVTDSDGFIKWAPHNLLLNSESFDTSNWTKGGNSLVSPNVTSSPNGTTTADRISVVATSGQAQVYQINVSTVSSTYVAGAFLKADTASTWAALNLYDAALTNKRVWFNLNTGAKGTEDAGITGTITALSNGWYYCTVSRAVTGATGGLAVEVCNADNSTSGTAGDAIFAWGSFFYRSDLNMQANTSAYPMYNPTTPKNLLGYTEDFSNAAWGKVNILAFGSGSVANAAVAPNGLQTADLVVPNTTSGTHVLQQGPAVVNGTAYVSSLYVKPAGYTKIAIRDNSAFNRYVSFNLSGAGSVLDNGSSATGTIAALSDGWYRIQMSATAGATTHSVTYYFLDNAYTTGDPLSYNYAGNGTSGIYLWGAQLSDSASLDTYSPVYGAAVTSAAYYGPRRDFDGATLACKGLLVEEQRTNLVLNSAAFDDASWAKAFAGTGVAPVVTPNSGIAPDGTMSADQIVFNAGAGTTASDLSLVSATTTTTAVNYATSIWLRTLSGTATILIRGAAISSFTALTVTSSWQRFSTVELGVAGTGTRIDVGLRQGLSGIGTINSTATILAWGAQLEAGSFATSYIPTGAATATRNADVASVSTQAFPYSATEGTLVASGSYVGFGSPAPAFSSITDGSTSVAPSVSWVVLYQTSTTMSALRRSNSTNATAIDVTNAQTANEVRKVGVAFAVGGTDGLSVNGGAVATQAGVASSYANTILRIGTWSSNPGYLNGHIRQITYLPRRISNTELQTRTQ